MLTTFTHVGTYHYAVIARKFVNARRSGLALVAGTTFLVGGLEDFKVVVINIVAVKDISDELQGRGFANTSLPKKQDGVWSLFLRCADDPLLERLDEAGERRSEQAHQDCVHLLDSRGGFLVL